MSFSVAQRESTFIINTVCCSPVHIRLDLVLSYNSSEGERGKPVAGHLINGQAEEDMKGKLFTGIHPTHNGLQLNV